MVTSSHRAPAEFVGRAEARAAFDAGAHHPAGEPVRIVIATGGACLVGRHAAELGRPEHERIVQQAALLQIGQQCGGGLIEESGQCRS